jgi:hypothetical protein
MPGFSSIELNDGTGDMAAVPTVFHNIHCLVRLLQDILHEEIIHTYVSNRVKQQAIREMFFPEYYLNTWEIFKPLHKGGIHPHMDHCIEKYVSSLVRRFYNTVLTDATTVVSVNPSCVTPTCLCTPTGGSLNRRNPRS